MSACLSGFPSTSCLHLLLGHHFVSATAVTQMIKCSTEELSVVCLCCVQQTDTNTVSSSDKLNAG